MIKERELLHKQMRMLTEDVSLYDPHTAGSDFAKLYGKSIAHLLTWFALSLIGIHSLKRALVKLIDFFG